MSRRWHERSASTYLKLSTKRTGRLHSFGHSAVTILTSPRSSYFQPFATCGQLNFAPRHPQEVRRFPPILSRQFPNPAGTTGFSPHTSAVLSVLAHSRADPAGTPC